MHIEHCSHAIWEAYRLFDLEMNHHKYKRRKILYQERPQNELEAWVPLVLPFCKGQRSSKIAMKHRHGGAIPMEVLNVLHMYPFHTLYIVLYDS